MDTSKLAASRDDAMRVLDQANGADGQWWSMSPRMARRIVIRRARRAVELMDEAQELLDSIPPPSKAVPVPVEPVPVKPAKTAKKKTRAK